MAWIGIVLMLLVALFMLLPGAYWVVNPTVPSWARPWMLWPLKSTGRDVLRLQGWAGVLIGIAWLLLLAGNLLGSSVHAFQILVPTALAMLLIAILVWGWSVAKSFAAARSTPAASSSAN